MCNPDKSRNETNGTRNWKQNWMGKTADMNTNDLTKDKSKHITFKGRTDELQVC